MQFEQAYDFDDVLLKPKISMINSRDEVDLKSKFHDLYPIISSPMKYISGTSLCIEMSKNNCLGILHRFHGDYVSRTNDIVILSKNCERIDNKLSKFGVAIGIRDEDKELEIAKFAIDCGACVICVDVANGYMMKLSRFISKLKKLIDNTNVKIMAGNIAGLDGAEFLAKSGVDFIRIGVGPGALCRTRAKTGCGVPQITAILKVSEIKKKYPNVFLIADGGIRTPSDFVKSLACGADFVMMGSVLAGAHEAEHENGIICGMASAQIQNENGGNIKSIEGVSVEGVKKTDSLKNILNDYLYSLKSACSYLNSPHYLDLPENSQFLLVKKSKII